MSDCNHLPTAHLTMTAMATDSSNSGLVFTGRLPLAWREVVKPPNAIELQSIERSNLLNLHTLFALDMHVGDFSDDPITLANATELKRLDFKVGLLLEMVGQLYARQQAIPAEHSLTLMVNGLMWQAETAPAPGVLLELELYCSLSYPRPLTLYARLAESAAENDGWRIRALFENPSAALHEALERYIFLQHRRTIAHSRRYHSR